MLNQQIVYKILSENHINFFTGVPDSFLNGFCNYGLEQFSDNFIIAANEGNAIAIAAGHYFATKEIPLVYMQNSGMGISINPLASLVDKNVYSVPMIILIGWRGHNGTEKSHPQHKLQGEITPKLLDVMHIPYSVLSDDITDFSRSISKAVSYCKLNKQPYCLLSPKGIMADTKKEECIDDSFPLGRNKAIEIILDNLPYNSIFVASTGRITRELFHLRKKRNEDMRHDFLNVGAMGHASSVALGIALEHPERKVIALDGDAAAIMHLGAFTMASKLKLSNFMHIVLNNGVHESVGGQPSTGHMIDFTQIAKACGYETVDEAVTDEILLVQALKKLSEAKKTSFIDLKIHKGSETKLQPIEFSHKNAIESFIEELNKGSEFTNE